MAEVRTPESLLGSRGGRVALLVVAVVLLAVVPAVEAGPGKAEAQPKAAKTQAAQPKAAKTKVPSDPAARGADVKDTHDRLARIYERLGIRRAARKAPERPQGCSCNPRRSGERKDKPSSKWRPPSLPPALGWILIAIVVIGMLVPLVLALRSGYRDVAPTVQETGADREDDDDTPDASAPWQVSLARCRKLVAEGKLAEAYGALHRLTLVALEGAGHLSLEASITNWQYVSRLISKPPLREVLAEVTIAAERSVLGHQPPPSSRFDELVRLLEGRLALNQGEGGAP